MLRIGVGLSIERDSVRAGAQATAAALDSASLDAADLLVVFATTPHGPGFTAVTRAASDIAHTRNVVGCSAAGVLAREQEIEGGPGVAVLAMRGDIAPRRFFVPCSRGAGDAIAAEIANSVGAPSGSALLLLFTDSYNVDMDGLLAGLTRRFPGVPIVGGGASEDGSVGQVSVFAGDAASSGAVSGVLVDGDVRTTVGVAHGAQRVGRVHRVGEVRGNWILTLDDAPAYEAFARVVPAPLLEEPRRAVAVVLAGLGVGDGQYVARHLVGLDVARGAIAIAAEPRPGDEMFFAVRDPGGARAELQRVLAEQAAAWSTRAAAGGLYVDCIGRGRAFYGVPGLDTAYIRQHMGSLPVAGFFSGAEFAPGAGAARLHQYTGVLAVLGSAA